VNRRPLLSSAAAVLAVGFLVLFIGGGARFAIGLTLKSVVEEFGWGRTKLGIAVALFQFVSAVCMYVTGTMADRTNPRLVLGGGLIMARVRLRAVVHEPVAKAFSGEVGTGSPQKMRSLKDNYH
jgi:sugar phosphate permease